jgi:hypothetical protein
MREQDLQIFAKDPRFEPALQACEYSRLRAACQGGSSAFALLVVRLYESTENIAVFKVCMHDDTPLGFSLTHVLYPGSLPAAKPTMHGSLACRS